MRIAPPAVNHRSVAVSLSHILTGSNTMNRVHVAATELQQLLQQKTKYLERQPHNSCCQTLCSSKVNWKDNCWKSKGHVPQCPVDGDVDGNLMGRSHCAYMRENRRMSVENKRIESNDDVYATRGCARCVNVSLLSVSSMDTCLCAHSVNTSSRRAHSQMHGHRDCLTNV